MPISGSSSPSPQDEPIELLAVSSTDAIHLFSLNPAHSADRSSSTTPVKFLPIASWSPFKVVPDDPVLAKYSHPKAEIRCIAWSHDGQNLAVGGTAPWIEIYTWQGQLVESFPIIKPAENPDTTCVQTMEFASESRTVVYGGSSRQVRRYDRQAKCIAQSFQSHKTAITAAALSVDKSMIASGSNRGDITLFNRKNGTKAELKFGTRHAINNLQFSIKRKHTLAAISDDGAVAVWDTHRAATPVKLFSRVHSAPSRGLAFSPASSYTLFSAGLDQKIVVFDLLKRSITETINTEYPINTLAIHSDGNHLFAGTLTGQVILYDTRLPAKHLEIVPLEGPAKPVVAIHFQGDSKINRTAFEKHLKTLVPPAPAPAPTVIHTHYRRDSGQETKTPPTPPQFAIPFTQLAVSPTPLPLSLARSTTPPPYRLADTDEAVVPSSPPPSAALKAPALPDKLLTPASPTSDPLTDNSMVARDRSYMELFSPVGRPAVTRMTSSPLQKAHIQPRTYTPALCSPTKAPLSLAKVDRSPPNVVAAPKSNLFGRDSAVGSRPPLSNLSPRLFPPLHITPQPPKPPSVEFTLPPPWEPQQRMSTTGASLVATQRPTQPTVEEAPPSEPSLRYTEGDSILDVFSPIASQKKPVVQTTPAKATTPVHPRADDDPGRFSLNRNTPKTIRKSALKNRLKHLTNASPGPSDALDLLPSPSPTTKGVRKVIFAAEEDLLGALPRPPSADHPIYSATKRSPPTAPVPPHSPGPTRTTPSLGRTKASPRRSPGTAKSTSSVGEGFQLTLMQNLINESLQNFGFDLRQEFHNLHLEMLRQFHIQEQNQEDRFNDLRNQNEILSELARLREENKRLKSELGYQ
ncbi:hypothetical protein H4R33_003681 [Dimargaris cristalligena]|nr:hypothetical protein H4R33_003681 [Dimargaris cristalligena]